MSAGEAPAAPPATRRTRRRRRRGRSILFLALAISAALLGSIPIARRLMERGSPGAAAIPARRYDLVLSEAAFAGTGAHRHIAGAVRNQSVTPYRDIEVSFAVRDRSQALVATVTARVEKLGGSETARFRTGPVPEAAVRLGLRDISGTPR